MAIQLTPTQWMLLSLLVEKAMKAAFEKFGEMSEDELRAEIAKEEARTEELVERLDESDMNPI